MLEIHCTGTPYQIGFQHGQGARTKIENGLKFYESFFAEKTRMNWATAISKAELFLPFLEHGWKHLLEELKGVADGAGVLFGSILALNVRTEISMGMMNDGCTSLAWKTLDVSYLAQNWDWEPPQQDNLIVLHIKRDAKPSISQVTEAGIIGKVGLNSCGVGVCLNAIRVKGVDFNRLPGHLALRAVLDSKSRKEAVNVLKEAGVAAAIHILVADPSGSTSIEASSRDLVVTDAVGGRITHSNHFCWPHAQGVPVTVAAPDSLVRLERVNELMDSVSKGGTPDRLMLESMLNDEYNAPFGINKAGNVEQPLRTLFSIVMELSSRSARVRFGRPTDDAETVALCPEQS
ncbi:putative acyl-coenzyme A:6-aminopenicillanic-acid-acyltransferase 40 kDa form [Exophiala viscosa]|uniref:Acyl-coenzyme A:6-aminopenicillanic-acid-acyltransferase 40 kDa form n=1 Tax=Exophiala viscosa TaxID=2486360 RepID=A0AAN6E6R8_9EURO|nr:putative acyl-coenzyme A:6-aminopenicillanic-acid-acyltransferase 40 kDa form [Exophiala viscosa]KAI1626797.1 putative acyl-coenzyme A:6-aminopenicillanic-acid-acyltransferase 40 kDa form [Exophiala viscosa]